MAPRYPCFLGVSSFHHRVTERKSLLDGKDTPGRQYAVLMIAPTSFFSDYGCSVRILEEIRALRRMGHTVTVCTYRTGQDVPGLSIRRTPGIPLRAHREVGSSPHKIAFDLLLFWTVLIAALRHRPDVIHAHMHEGAVIGLAVGRLLRVPMVFDFQGSLTGEMMDHKFLRRDSPFYRPLRWLETLLDHKSRIILTSSHNARDLLITQFGCLPGQLQTVPDGVDAAAFYPPAEGEQDSLAQRRASLQIPPGRKIVVYLGLLAGYQGTDALLEAAARLLTIRDDVHFLIMGFPSVEDYRHKARQCGIAGHTTFTGKIPYDQARNYLALGDVAVAPKLSATEGSGKILNYMAMGLPTVAFETPVSREYLGSQGIYAAVGDASSLARALLSSLEDQQGTGRGEVLRRMAIDAHTWDHAAQTIVAAYGRICR
jgi:glycosyltransferase involved in cell wall biosynthesis